MLRNELADHFKSDLFTAEMQASTKEEAIEEVLQLFVQEKYIRNPSIVLDMLRQREKLGSTGIGKGVAIPHGRTLAASDVLIAFGKSSAGIEFDAIDQKPVHLIFMVIAPPHEEKNIYLPILGSLVTVLNDEKNRERFMSVDNYEDFIKIISGE